MKKDKQLINIIEYSIYLILMLVAFYKGNTNLLIVASTWAILAKLDIIREELK